MASVRWSETGSGARPCRLREALELAPGLDDLDGALGHARPAGHGEGKEVGRGVRLSQSDGAGARMCETHEQGGGGGECARVHWYTKSKQCEKESAAEHALRRKRALKATTAIYDSPDCLPKRCVGEEVTDTRPATTTSIGPNLLRSNPRPRPRRSQRPCTQTPSKSPTRP